MGCGRTTLTKNGPCRIVSYPYGTHAGEEWMRLQPMADHPEMLALIVEKAMERCGLAEYGPLVHCGTPNFATIPRTAATKLASQMEESYTVSHSRAWQKKLDAGPFLVKLYQAHGKNWQIAIVSIGWRHLVQTIWFIGRLPGWSTINVRNARRYAKLAKIRLTDEGS